MNFSKIIWGKFEKTCHTHTKKSPSRNSAEHGVFHYAKFTTATGESTGIGTLILEGGHAIQGSTEAQFAATVERLEGSGEITGTAYEGDWLNLFSINYYNC